MSHYRPIGPRSAFSGFTLVELMVTISIVSIMLVLVAPGFADFMRKQRLIAATDGIASAIGQARTRALAQNVYVTIAPINGDWKNGWQVFSEGQNPDGVYNAPTDTPCDRLKKAHKASPKVDFYVKSYREYCVRKK